MRLRSLHLERYGSFTGRSLSFREDARLHIVLGANEAGKSTALCAVTDLLFGIEPRTRHAYLHDMPDLRLGAEIVANDGRRLAFRRRKGTRNTLVDAADAPLPEDALAPFLQGLTREVFCRAFGLDAQCLRLGGREMLDADGEVGASLFAAASGLRGYRQLQANLDEEAAGIFAPRKAASRIFYQALERHEEARRAIRAAELRGGDWRELNEEIEAAAGRLDAVHAERRRIGTERVRLERLRRVAPLIAGLDELEERLRAGPVLPEASDAWIERLSSGLAAVEQAVETHTEAQAALAEAERDIAAVPPDIGLVAHAGRVFEAFRGIDRFDKDGLDLPRIEREADAFGKDLARLAVRIGLPDAEALRRGQPTDASRTRIETLIREGRDLASLVTRLSREMAERDEERARLADPDEAGAPVDPAPLRADLRVLAGRHGGLHANLARHDALGATIRSQAELLKSQAARLTPPVADLTALVAAGTPSQGAVARFRQRADALEREQALAAAGLDAAAKMVAQTERSLRRLEAGRPIPTEAELTALRGERDRLRAPLRAAALGETLPLGLAAAADYEAASLRADRAADALASDAARVAEKAADLARLDTQRAEHETARAALSALDGRLADAQAAWLHAWEPSGIRPAAPAEMAVWLTEIEALVDTHDALEQRRIERDGLVGRVEAARAPLADLGRRAGLDGLDGADVGLLLARVEDRIADLGGAWDASRERQARCRAAAAVVARLAVTLDEARGRQASWQGAWTQAVGGLSLRAGVGPDEAESALDAWRAVPGALAEHDNRLTRVAGIRRDMAAYETNVARLCRGLAPDLSDLPATAAMKGLHDRLQAALGRESRRQELARHRDAASRRHETAARAVQTVQTALAEHLAALGGAGIGTDSQATDLYGRLKNRQALRTELAERRVELVRAADGLSEAELRTDLAAQPIEAIEAALQGLSLKDEDLDRNGKLAFSDRDRFERRRAELEAGVGAETAAARKNAAEAELRAAARQWAVLRFASLMLGTAVARHRAGQQDPLLTRAGDLFSTLTGGGFAGLAQDYGEADEPRIVGRRAPGGRGSGPGSALVPLEGLSEGTRDQLYLALRLAYLEDYATRVEPAPFVGDDLFSTFDDVRTGHGLGTLAAIGDSLQPILFTHHRHVADLAQSRLGERVDVVAL